MTSNADDETEAPSNAQDTATQDTGTTLTSNTDENAATPNAQDTSTMDDGFLRINYISALENAPTTAPSDEESDETVAHFALPAEMLQLTFTCTVEECGIRSTHAFAKKSYQRGIVLVQCPGCKNR